MHYLAFFTIVQLLSCHLCTCYYRPKAMYYRITENMLVFAIMICSFMHFVACLFKRILLSAHNSAVCELKQHKRYRFSAVDFNCECCIVLVIKTEMSLRPSYWQSIYLSVPSFAGLIRT